MKDRREAVFLLVGTTHTASHGALERGWPCRLVAMKAEGMVGRYWKHRGQMAVLALFVSAANDPTATLG